jgi:hypothetical protein
LAEDLNRPTKIQNITFDLLYLEPEDSGGANAKEAESVYQQRRMGHPVLTCIIMGKQLFSVSMAFSELLTVFYKDRSVSSAPTVCC